MDKTGDSGWGLRMALGGSKRAIIRMAPPGSGNIAAERAVLSPDRAYTKRQEGSVKVLVQWLIDWPRRVAGHLTWLAPLVARIVVGWVFLWSGWGKLNNLPTVTDNFVGWGIPAPHLLAPFVSGVEFFGGLFLLLGLLTRISAGALGVTMIVAIRSAKWADVDSLETLLGFDETEYLALFLWLAIAGAGAVSLDHYLEGWYRRRAGTPVRA
jgi:putative oxidoreductase